jgi:hypothetical protein
MRSLSAPIMYQQRTRRYAHRVDQRNAGGRGYASGPVQKFGSAANFEHAVAVITAMVAVGEAMNNFHGNAYGPDYRS